MPSTVSWPEMGGPTAHSTKATLALGDPPRSLNAPEESLGYLLRWRASGFVLWVGLEQFLVSADAASAAVLYGQGSDRQNDPPHHRGNIEEVSYLENKAPLRHNQSMESDQGCTGVVVP